MKISAPLPPLSSLAALIGEAFQIGAVPDVEAPRIARLRGKDDEARAVMLAQYEGIAQALAASFAASAGAFDLGSDQLRSSLPQAK
jgi:hypothetical protein